MLKRARAGLQDIFNTSTGLSAEISGPSESATPVAHRCVRRCILLLISQRIHICKEDPASTEGPTRIQSWYHDLSKYDGRSSTTGKGWYSCIQIGCGSMDSVAVALFFFCVLIFAKRHELSKKIR